MAKFKHINIASLIYLSGLRDDLAMQYARFIDPEIEKMMLSDQDDRFRRWRKSASFTNLSNVEYFIGFHVVSAVSSEGRTATMMLVDFSPSDGAHGQRRRGAYLYIYAGTEEASEIISIPLVYLLREFGSVVGMHTLYEHGAVNYHFTVLDAIRSLTVTQRWTPPIPVEPHGANGMIYVGLTSRPWAVRYREHLHCANSGSTLPFHRAIREQFGQYNTRFHYVLAMAKDRDIAMDFEEQLVAKRSLYPKGLNAIPGGKAGIRYLASINAIQPGERLQPEDIEDRLWSSISAANSAGRSNPLVAAKWNDPEYAVKVITGHPDHLSIDQVRLARYEHALGRSPSEIAETIKARNVDVVKRLLSGVTYGRIQ